MYKVLQGELGVAALEVEPEDESDLGGSSGGGKDEGKKGGKDEEEEDEEEEEAAAEDSGVKVEL
jgi:hypothetical protein